MFTLAQIILMTLLMLFIAYDLYHTQIFVYGRAVFCGLLAGIIMNNVTLGLLIGGTMELMSLGVGGYGGSSVPNYNIGTIVGVAFAVSTNKGIDAALAVGIPVAALGVQLDVLGKMAGSFFYHKALKAVDSLQLKKMYHWILLGTIPRVAFAGLVVLLAMTAGATAIQTILNALPAFITSGLNIAGGVLPAVGFAILLRYMPLKKHYIFVILGFILTSYLSLPMIAVALLGFIIAVTIYNKNEENSKQVSAADTQGGDDYDE